MYGGELAWLATSVPEAVFICLVGIRENVTAMLSKRMLPTSNPFPRRLRVVEFVASSLHVP